jgi:hypothetical protein
MGDFFNTTNTIVSIIAGLVTIFGAIAAVLKKRQTALSASQYQPLPVQIQIQEKWSGLGLIWRIWMGILLGIVFAVMFTAVPDGIINIFMAVINSMQTHGFTNPDFSNPVVFAICAIFGVSMGITVAVGVATGRQKLYVSQ